MQQYFNGLIIPSNHPGHAPSNTYYITHQSQYLHLGIDSFICSGDVCRWDNINAMHPPAFHQMEDIKLMLPRLVVNAYGFHENDWLESPECRLVELGLSALWKGSWIIFLDQHKRDGTKTTFLSHSPALNSKWMELLGCGVIIEEVLQLSSHANR
ncbi:hypothetical protein ACHAW6_012018 [Cyclotella cf. meneghiniana]